MGLKMKNENLIGLKIGEIGAYIYMLDESQLHTRVGDINCIIECGALAAADTVALADYFGCPVHTFEPNQNTIDVCRSYIGDRTDITLNQCAVADYDGHTVFYPVNIEAYPNPGASSMYRFDMDYSEIHPPEVLRAGNAIQDTTMVSVTKLETYCKNNSIQPQALFMDIQGAELAALRGLGDYIDGIKLIGFEMQYSSSYKDGCVFEETDEFLKSKGFEFAWCWQTHSNQLPPVPYPMREHWYDVLYIRKDTP